MGFDEAGRRVRVIHPGAEPESQRTTTTTYDDLDRVIAVDGAKTYPLAYEYDLNGRMTALIDGEGSRTEWAYDPLGRLTQKTYADGTDYDYTYDDEGSLASRTDAKGQTTTYAYDDLGRLTTIDYPNDTDIVTAYDDLGRRISRSDTTGLWTWTYDGDSSRVLTVTDPDANVASYTYDTSGQRTGLTLTVDGADVMDLDYTTTNGRLTGIDSETNVGGALRAAIFSYSYLPDSDLLESLVHNNGTTDILTTTRTHDDADRLLSISSTTDNPQPTTVSSFSYTLDATGRRIARTDHDLPRHSSPGATAGGTRLHSTHTPPSRLQRVIAGDRIRLRRAATAGQVGNHLGQSKNGTAIQGRYNNLNQLLEREIAGAVRVQGTADGVLPIGVKVDGDAAATADIDADTTAFRGDSSPIQPGQTGDKAISIVATDSADPAKRTESTRTVQLPATNPVAFTYDLNGNMLTDGQWTYTWNDENRMVSAQEAPNVGGASARRLLFSYDGQGRRRTKKVQSWDPPTEDWALNTEHLFLYDGWNLICEVVTDHTQAPVEETTKSYVWGLDLSQTLQGAGGVGGLLSVNVGGAVPAANFPCYDGNGNIVALVDSSDATVAAEYDYAPFGTTVKATGPAAEDNVWRFSTKYHDTETGLVYYGLRSYSPQLGRWMNRDPIGEAGGANLYSCVANSPVLRVDVYGLWSLCKTVVGGTITDSPVCEKDPTNPYNLPPYGPIVSYTAERVKVDVQFAVPKPGGGGGNVLGPIPLYDIWRVEKESTWMGRMVTKHYEKVSTICCGLVVWTKKGKFLLETYGGTCNYHEREVKFVVTLPGKKPHNPFVP